MPNRDDRRHPLGLPPMGAGPSALAEGFISMNEIRNAAIEGGFTRAEAMELVKSVLAEQLRTAHANNAAEPKQCPHCGGTIPA